MNHSLMVPRRRWVLLALCVAVGVAAVATVRHFPAPGADHAGLAALVAERDRLRLNSDAARDALRSQVLTTKTPAWTDERLAALQDELGPQWGWTWEPTVDGADRRGSVRALALELKRWPAYLAAVQALERQPGLVIERIDIAADGAGAARRFARVVLTVRLLRPRARTPGRPERSAATGVRSRQRGERRRSGGQGRPFSSPLRRSSAYGSRLGSAPAQTGNPARVGRPGRRGVSSPPDRNAHFDRGRPRPPHAGRSRRPAPGGGAMAGGPASPVAGFPLRCATTKTRDPAGRGRLSLPHLPNLPILP